MPFPQLTVGIEGRLKKDTPSPFGVEIARIVPAVNVCHLSKVNDAPPKEKEAPTRFRRVESEKWETKIKDDKLRITVPAFENRFPGLSLRSCPARSP